MGMVDDLGLFSKAGITLPRYEFVPIGHRPVLFSAEKFVIKAVGKNIVHKTDIGAIKMNVDKESVELEIRRMRNKLEKLRPEGFLIQEQVPKGIEVIIGAKRDLQFGDVVLFGVGGVYVELYKDVSVRLCPVSDTDALEMINETKAGHLLEGFRGRPSIDKCMVAGIIKKVCAVMHRNPDIKEIDLNPVVLYPTSYSAVDVRVIR
ncbi:MAG: acetate--CoA ligase family protein [Candidatus Micrarchaeia archaeon]